MGGHIFAIRAIPEGIVRFNCGNALVGLLAQSVKRFGHARVQSQRNALPGIMQNYLGFDVKYQTPG